MPPPFTPIVNEPLSTQDGVPFSVRYGDIYASRDGALGQARHVFVGGCDLPAAWHGRAQFVILETGFGLGVNFMATWQAWRADPARARHLHFVSIEAHPLTAADLLAHAPPALAALAGELAAAWPLPLPGLHRLLFDAGAVTLTLAVGEVQAVVPHLMVGADAVFLDGFAPARNPAMWSPAVIKAVARLARPQARLATWCTEGTVRSALGGAGFEVQLRAGFGRRRQMLCACYAPRFRTRRHEPPPPYGGERQAVVIGAGLAGCSAAAALAARGWQVTVLEAAGAAASGASALPWGLLHPQVTPDDGRLARLSRAGFLTATRGLQRLDPQCALLWQQCGVLQQAASHAEEAAWQAMLVALGFPPALVQPVSAVEAAQRLGLRVRHGGLWFGAGALVSGPRWCQALLASGGEAIALHTSAPVDRLQRRDGHWQAVDGAGTVLAAAPVLIVANSHHAARLLGPAHVPLAAVRGRISWLTAPALRALRAGLAGDGYLLHAPDGSIGVGASYEQALPGATDPVEVDVALIHQANLQRLARLLAVPPAVQVSGVFDGLRCVAPDRLPLAGAVANSAAALQAGAALRGAQLADLPRQGGLYASFALGSRGLTLAALCAELIAAQVEGEPWPIEAPLAAAIDPARFLLRHLRRA